MWPWSSRGVIPVKLVIKYLLNDTNGFENEHGRFYPAWSFKEFFDQMFVSSFLGNDGQLADQHYILDQVSSEKKNVLTIIAKVDRDEVTLRTMAGISFYNAAPH